MIKINGKKYEYGNFPDGTLNMEVDTDAFLRSLGTTITWNYESQEEQIILYNLVKHFRNHNYTYIQLKLPYIPNARMDRVKMSNEVFTLKYFCDFVNELKFDNVYVLDAHSNVSTALLNNVRQIDVKDYIDKAIEYFNPDILFFPDEGAMKRYSDMVNLPYCFGMKRRDWKTGNILGLDIIDNGVELEAKKILIVDDICSKGGTFYHGAKKLKELGVNNIGLYVSHCENSILEGEFGEDKKNLLDCELIDTVYTTDSILTITNNKIKIINEVD